MKFKTDQEIIEHTIKQIDDSKLIGIIPFDLWNLILKYELRGWVLLNAEKYKFPELIKKIKNKIKNLEVRERSDSSRRSPIAECSRT